MRRLTPPRTPPIRAAGPAFAAPALVAGALPDLLQATYLPARRRVAFWGGGDLVEALRRLRLPRGRTGSFLAALPVRKGGVVDVRPARLPARLLPAAALMGLEVTPPGPPVSNSLRVWARAARMARTGAAEREWAALALAMPVAAHAVLGPDATSVQSARGVLAAFRDSVRPVSDRGRPVRVELREYQRRGVEWLLGLGTGARSGVLADDMGLGKTVEAICLLAGRCGDRPHLVVCPTSLLGNWARELARFAPEVPVLPHHGTDRGLGSASLPGGGVVITSYSHLRQDAALLQAVDWDVVILDEAQQIKNPQALATRAAAGLNALVRVAMTGTPVENRLEDLWSLMDVTNPGLLGNRARFRRRFAVPIEEHRSEPAARTLSRVIQPHLLRRTKREVAPDLPPKLESTVICTLTREQADLYRRCLRDAFDSGLGTGITRRGRVLALITRLKQACNHPEQVAATGGPLGGRSGKLDRTAEMLAEVVMEGERALVFTQYRVMGNLLCRHLADALGLRSGPFLHGGLSPPARDALVQAFQGDEAACPVLVVSLRAAGFGLNLTRATHVSTTTAGGTRRSRTRPATAPTASARSARSTSTRWSRAAPWRSASGESTRPSAASPRRWSASPRPSSPCCPIASCGPGWS